MPESSTRRLAVLGSPIDHSLSPTLHSRAYALLGVAFDYGRAEVKAGELPMFLAGLDETWRGLSLTMPLKREVVPLLSRSSELVRQLGVANTVVFEPTGLAGYNTDVDGIVRALGAQAEGRDRVTIVGGGATAASALAAAARLDVRSAVVALRDTAKAGELRALADALGVSLEVVDVVDLPAVHDFVISTLPGDADLRPFAPASPSSLLLDVAYDPWPSRLASRWEASGAVAVSGLDMLVEQAIGQIRLFTGRAQDQPLDEEPGIRISLRAAVGLPV